MARNQPTVKSSFGRALRWRIPFWGLNPKFQQLFLGMQPTRMNKLAQLLSFMSLRYVTVG